MPGTFTQRATGVILHRSFRRQLQVAQIDLNDVPLQGTPSSHRHILHCRRKQTAGELQNSNDDKLIDVVNVRGDLDISGLARFRQGRHCVHKPRTWKHEAELHQERHGDWCHARVGTSSVQRCARLYMPISLW